MGNRIGGDSLLRQTKEEFTSMFRSPEIEPEGELIQIVVEKLTTDRSRVGSHQPFLEHSDHVLNPWHRLRFSSVLLFSFWKRDLVEVASALQGPIFQQVVGVDDAAWRYRVLHKTYQACGRSVGNLAHPYPTDPGPVF